MTRPVICVETGGATGIPKMRRGHTDVSPGTGHSRMKRRYKICFHGRENENGRNRTLSAQSESLR